MPRKGGVINLQMLISWMEAGSSWLTMTHECRIKMDAEKWIWVLRSLELKRLTMAYLSMIWSRRESFHSAQWARSTWPRWTERKEYEHFTLSRWRGYYTPYIFPPPNFNLYDQGNKRVDKSQTHHNDHHWRLTWVQDTNADMLHQVMNTQSW